MKSFTIIIPCFNSEKYIETCLNSLLKINYVNNLIEVLIVDDGSTDKTWNIAQAYALKFSFIKCYRKENNHWGSVINYVKNNKLANGDYVSVLDSDDQLVTESLNILNDLSKINDDDLLVGSFEKWDGNRTRGKITPYWFLLKRTLTSKQQMNTPFCLPLTFFSKKEVFYQLNNLTEKMAYQDPDYLSQLVKYSKSLTFTKAVVGLYYFNREGNSMSESWNENRFYWEYNACKKLIDNNAQEVVAFRLCQKGFRNIINQKQNNFFETERNFYFDWFPIYLRFFWFIFFQLKIKKFFKNTK